MPSTFSQTDFLKGPFRTGVWLCLAVLCLIHPARSETVATLYTDAELIAEYSSVAPGDTLWAALRLKPHPDWHVYWENPGDAGMAPSLEWEMPPGFTAGEILFPYPERIAAGPLASFGYSGEVFYPVRIAVPSDISTGASVTLRARADWLVCKVECLPAEAELSLHLGIDGKKSYPPETSLWRDIRAKLPRPSPEWDWKARVEADTVVVTGVIPTGWEGGGETAFFFAGEQGVMANAGSQRLEVAAGRWEVRVPRDPVVGARPDTLQGLLVFAADWRPPGEEAVRALSLAAVAMEESPSSAARAGISTAVGATGGPASQVTGMVPALLFALLGGILLNLMPCVLPVLSLKILDFVNKAGQRRSLTVLHGLVFTGGVLLSFWALAGTLILLQQGGAQLGWGFQLQSPVFVFALSAFLFLFGLNMLGVFEMGTLFTRLGNPGSRDSHYLGSFAGGVTATLVATPCTAPFMGAALGYGFTLSPLANLALFTAVGLGMAFPYLLLSFFPGSLRFLPPPGRWMESLKQFMGFLLLGTVIWLSWVLGHLVGNDGVSVLLAVLLGIGLGAWILGRWTGLHLPPRRRLTAFAAVAAIWTATLWSGGNFMAKSNPASNPGSQPDSLPTTPAWETGIDWEPFSPERLKELRDRKEPVFVNFTAAWCLTCKVNERMALRSPEVIERFHTLGIHALKADWTARDASLARVLAGYGRNGIPFYVFYDGRDENPLLLPELLTPALLLETLRLQ